jgi:hypothetical protein
MEDMELIKKLESLIVKDGVSEVPEKTEVVTGATESAQSAERGAGKAFSGFATEIEPIEDVLRYADMILSGESLVVYDKLSDKVPFDIDALDWHMQVTKSPNTFLLYLHAQKPVLFLTEAFAATKERKYMDLADKFLRSWFEYNAGTQKKIPQAWYDHGVAMRAEHILYFVQTVASGAPDIDALWLLPELRNHASWLLDNKNYYFRHNHGIFEDVALYRLGQYFNEKSYNDVAVARLTEQLRCAYPYRVHTENSMGYNIGSFSLLVELEGLFNGKDCDEIHKIIENVKSSSIDFLVCAYRPDLSLPPYGDTFGSPKDGRGAIDTHGSPFLEYIASKGEKGEMPPDNVRLFKEDGFAFVRSSYDKDAFAQSTQIMFRCGYNSMTHKHKDELSLCLWSKGFDVLIDPGMYNYMLGNAIHDYTNGIRAHSSVCVDNADYPIGENTNNRCGMSDMTAESGRYRFSAYNDMYYGVRIDRDLIYMDENTLIIIDNVDSDDRHAYSQIFHLSEHVNLKLAGGGVCVGELPNGWKVAIRQILRVDGAEVVSGQNALTSDMSVRSIGMNTVLPTATVKFGVTGSRCRFVTVCQLFESPSELYSAVADDAYLYCRGRKFSLEPARTGRTADLKIVVSRDALIAIVPESVNGAQLDVSLLNCETGKVISSKRISKANYGTVDFALRQGFRYAVKANALREDGQSSEELYGTVVDEGAGFHFVPKALSERRPFVTAKRSTQCGKVRKYWLETVGFNSASTGWYIYKNGASYDFKNGGTELEYEFKEPGKYFVSYKIRDLYFGEIDKGNFPEIETV